VPDSLPAALFRHAAARPEEPWLFHRQGWDWRWLPWRSVAGRVAVWIAALSSLPTGTRAAFAEWPGPQAVALDLALQGAGLTSAPVPRELSGAALCTALAERRAEVWIETEGSERPAEVGLPVHSLPAWTEEGPSGLGRSGLVPPPPKIGAGGAIVSCAAGGAVLAAGDLIAVAERIEALLPAGRRGREIVVSSRPLADPGERQLLAWATWTGAALLLEADRGASVATAVWARPTLFHGDARELALLRQAVPRSVLERLGRRPRRPFGRLHTILLDGDLPPDEQAFWEGRGVRVQTIPHPYI
jgi:hypothetical protein